MWLLGYSNLWFILLILVYTDAKHAGVKYPCPECNYRATSTSNLKLHTDAKHAGVKYPCNKCDYQATQQASLKTHFDSKHAGVRYPCDQCDYKATTQVRMLGFKTRRDIDILYYYRVTWKITLNSNMMVLDTHATTVTTKQPQRYKDIIYFFQSPSI